MGSGAARELEGEVEVPPLDSESAAKLTTALNALDAVDAEFKNGRDEERYAQHVKTWNRVCKEVEDNLRLVGKSLNQSHQLSLDMGVVGGGPNARPFIEEVNGKLGKLEFKMSDGMVEAVYEGQVLGNTGLHGVDYGFIEPCVVNWVVAAVSKRAR